MALNILGALGAFGRLLPGYVQGERQAVQDNWNDLNQYNQTQAGQIQNAWDEAMFNPRLSMGYDAAAQSRMGVYNTGMNTNINRQMYPSLMANAAIQSQFAPYLATMNALNQLGPQLGMFQQQWNPASMNYWGNLASAMGGMQAPWGQQMGINPQQGAIQLPSALR